MKKIDRMIQEAQRKYIAIKDTPTYRRMSTDDLRELAYGNPSEQRVREIFAHACGLALQDKLAGG